MRCWFCLGSNWCCTSCSGLYAPLQRWQRKETSKIESIPVGGTTCFFIICCSQRRNSRCRANGSVRFTLCYNWLSRGSDSFGSTVFTLKPYSDVADAPAAPLAVTYSSNAALDGTWTTKDDGPSDAASVTDSHIKGIQSAQRQTWICPCFLAWKHNHLPLFCLFQHLDRRQTQSCRTRTDRCSSFTQPTPSPAMLAIT